MFAEIIINKWNVTHLEIESRVPLETAHGANAKINAHCAGCLQNYTINPV
jgi:hypothetical protein